VSDLTRPVPVLQAARVAFGLGLEGLLWSRRALLMGLLVGAPVLFALVFRLVAAADLPAELTGFDIYGRFVSVYWLRNVLPLVALFFGAALVADEIEGKTITFLLTRPVTRPALLLGKFAAYLVASLALVLPALVLTFGLLVTWRGSAGVAARVPDLFRDLGVAALTLLVYGALFALLGVLLKRPLIPGLLFLFAWELLANLPGYLPRLTLSAYVRSLVPYAPAEEGVGGLFAQVLPFGECLAVLTVVTGLSLVLASWAFTWREYVLEQ
jgi:ABC-type transport system involved in multi-copper enzyme maturation permease subunit